MSVNNNTSLSIFYTLLLLSAIILAGTTIKTGKSEKKTASWALFSFSVIFGIIVLGLCFYVKCKEGANKTKQYLIPGLTFVMCISNMVGMIISKPNLPVSQLFVPHLANISLFVGSVFYGMSICKCK